MYAFLVRCSDLATPIHPVERLFDEKLWISPRRDLQRSAAGASYAIVNRKCNVFMCLGRERTGSSVKGPTRVAVATAGRIHRFSTEIAVRGDSRQIFSTLDGCMSSRDRRRCKLTG